MARFLLITPRDSETVAAAEYRDFLVNGHLTEDDLDQRLINEAHPRLPELSGYAGILVGGSPYNVTTAEKTPTQKVVEDELARLIDCGTPVLFVCYGTGILASRRGGAVGRTHPEDAGRTRIILTSEAATDPLCKGLPEHFSALAGHTENVTDPGECVSLAGGGCPHQVLRYGTQTWACQFHAEMDAQAMETRMGFYRDYGYFNAEDYDSIVATLDSIDTTYSARFLRNFLAYCTIDSRLDSQ